MKKMLIIAATAAMLVLFSGCELWLFVEGGGGVSSGIGVYADVSVAGGGTSVDPGQELRALLFKKGSSTFNPVQEKVGDDGAEVLQATFKDVDSGTYKVVVYYDSLTSGASDDSPDWNTETGYTSSEFFYQSGDYEGLVIDQASQWDVNNVQQP